MIVENLEKHPDSYALVESRQDTFPRKQKCGAVDRLRFKQRIANSEANMNIILDVNHRLVIYNNRFK